MQWIHLGADDWTGTSGDRRLRRPRPRRAARTTPATLGQVMPGFGDLSRRGAGRRHPLRPRDALGRARRARDRRAARGARPQEAIDEADERRGRRRATPSRERRAASPARRPADGAARADRPGTTDRGEHRPPRRPRRRRRPGRGGDGVLAGRGRATTSSSSRRRRSPARRPAATASRPGPSSSSPTWASPAGSPSYHRYDGLRAVAHGITLELQWPEHPIFPSPRLRRPPARPRRDRRRAGGRRPAPTLARRAPRRSARSCDDGLVARRGRRRTRSRGVDARDPRPATSSSPTAPTPASAGRSAPPATGPTRRAWPSAATSRARCTTSRGSSRALDVRDRNGNSLPGYGWIFPVGDGTDQRRHRAAVDVPRLEVGQHLATSWPSSPPPRPAYWGIVARDRRAGRPPAGASRWPARSTRRSGPTWVVVGDAAGSINPFNGEGIDYAYETGRMAAGLLDEALATGDGMALQRYPALLAGGVRPLLQGGPAVRQGHRQPGAACAS